MPEPSVRRSPTLAIVGALAAASVVVAVLAASPSQVSAREFLGELRSPGEAAFVAAHRGDRSAAPENTLPAIEAAIAGSFDYVEVDIALTSDGYAVLLHDDTLDRTTSGTGALADHTLAEVRALDAGSWFDAAHAGTRVPTVEEFLDLLASSSKKGLVEFKGVWTPEAAASFAGAVSARALDDRIAVASFDARSIALIASAAPVLPRIAILRTLPDDVVAAARALDVRGIIAPGAAVLKAPEVITELHNVGLRIAVYTLNDDTRWQRAIDLGVDGIITDEPRVLTQWLAETAVEAQ